MSFCKKCGRPRGSATQFCTGCGARFDTAPDSGPPTVRSRAGTGLAQPDGAYADRPPGSSALIEQSAAPAAQRTVSNETGYEPSGGPFEVAAAEPTGPRSAVTEETATAATRDGPILAVPGGVPRAGAGTSESGRGGTTPGPTRSHEPARSHKPAARVPRTEDDPPVAPASRRRRRWTVAAAVTALAVAGGAAAFFLTQGHPAGQAAEQHRTVASVPPPRPATSTAATSATASPVQSATAQPAEQAARNLDAILLQFSTQRGSLQTAVNDVAQCRTVAAGANVIAGIATSRTTEIGRLSSIDWAAMPNGPTMQADLMTALQDSRQADQDYQQWATGLEASCQPPAGSGASFTAASTADTQAVAAKTTFVSLWRPVAASYALASRNLLETQL
jgi:hypothetical protein